jgi:molybdopterin-binding protein
VVRTFPVLLESAPLTPSHVLTGCVVDPGSFHFRTFRLTNPTAVDLPIVADTLSGGDPVLGWFVPGFTTADVDCVTANDDNNGANSHVEFTLPAGTTGELFVSTFASNAVFELSLQVGSDSAVVIEQTR